MQYYLIFGGFELALHFHAIFESVLSMKSIYMLVVKCVQMNQKYIPRFDSSFGRSLPRLSGRFIIAPIIVRRLDHHKVLVVHFT